MSCLYYYSLNDGNVEKYKISIDEEKLSKIKEKSIYKCGKKKKVSYEGVRFFKDNMYYTDFKEVDLGWREYRDGPDKKLYRYSFTEYVPTYLSQLIDIIISSSSEKAIRELFQMDLSKEFCGFQKEINDILNKASKISNSDYKNKINALNELNKLYFFLFLFPLNFYLLLRFWCLHQNWNLCYYSFETSNLCFFYNNRKVST